MIAKKGKAAKKTSQSLQEYGEFARIAARAIKDLQGGATMAVDLQVADEVNPEVVLLQRDPEAMKLLQ